MREESRYRQSLASGGREVYALPYGRATAPLHRRNPTLVSGRELPREQRTVVQPDEKIAICAYTLRIQPK